MSFRPLASFAICSLLAVTSLQAAAADAPAAAPTGSSQTPSKTALGDLSGFRAIARDTLKIVKTGDFGAAKKRIKDLELSWDEAEPKIKPLAPKEWDTVDLAIDRALKEVRAWRATKESSSQALEALIATMNAVK